MDKIIIAGGGLSGLTLALALSNQPAFDASEIILLDREEKIKNDRTWCFWAKETEVLPPVIHCQWDEALFYGTDFEARLDLQPYHYCMVRGIDFYNYALTQLRSKANVHVIRDQILQIDQETGIVQGQFGTYQGDIVFNSALHSVSVLPDATAMAFQHPFSFGSALADLPKGYTWLLQHFKGWIIETEEDCFDPALMTLMDYRVEQFEDTRFVYVLPLSSRRALVEYTVFSPALCARDAYDAALNYYIKSILGISTFKVVETEFGVIPMSDFPFSAHQIGKVIHIGTAAGFVKPSSGYAFLRTQRKLNAFVADWVKTGKPNPAVMRSNFAFRAADSIMLRVLRDRAYSGKNFFTDLFSKVPTEQILRFLDEDSTGLEMIRVMRSAPFSIFIPKAIQQFPVLGRL